MNSGRTHRAYVSRAR